MEFDLLTLPAWSLWLIGALILVIVEFFTTGFGILCFSFGCLAASLTSLFSGQVVIDVAVFSVVSLLCFIFLRPVILKLLEKHNARNDFRTNADALIGRTGLVSQEIPAGGSGRVRIDGDEWKAVSDKAEEAIPAGSKVTVLSRDSIIITVSKEVV